MPDPALLQLQQHVNRTQSDQSLSPAERVRRLRRQRDDLVALAGEAETYIGDLELQRDADAIRGEQETIATREDAEVRDDAVRQGVASNDELDRAGVPSHADLDDGDE